MLLCLQGVLSCSIFMLVLNVLRCCMLLCLCGVSLCFFFWGGARAQNSPGAVAGFTSAAATSPGARGPPTCPRAAACVPRNISGRTLCPPAPWHCHSDRHSRRRGASASPWRWLPPLQRWPVLGREVFLLRLLAGVEDGSVAVRKGAEGEFAEVVILLQPLHTSVLLDAALASSLASLVAEFFSAERHGSGEREMKENNQDPKP